MTGGGAVLSPPPLHTHFSAGPTDTNIKIWIINMATDLIYVQFIWSDYFSFRESMKRQPMAIKMRLENSKK